MLTIGQLARQAGCTVGLVRHYEKEGLLPPSARTEGNQRRYGEAQQRRLLFVRHARELGFNLPEIRELLAMADQPGASCRAVDELARLHLGRIRARIERLQAMGGELERMIGECSTGKVADCRIIEVLSDHRFCDHAHGREASFR